jgi:hypothetical protein
MAFLEKDEVGPYVTEEIYGPLTPDELDQRIAYFQATALPGESIDLPYGTIKRHAPSAVMDLVEGVATQIITVGESLNQPKARTLSPQPKLART